MAAIMGILGLGLAIAGGWFVYGNHQFLAATKRTEGTIVAVTAKRSAKGMTLYHPRARFNEPRTGRSVAFTSRVGLWPSPFGVGDKVVVAFDPNNPDDAKIVSLWTLWFIPGAMIALGALAVLLAASRVGRPT
ncbi:MAG: DUF3592 domain-containing protein [Alphaproteobacteria bacterium]|nr:DUF3592 domain-containing protein [Alphaproteobacteria bacterium]